MKKRRKQIVSVAIFAGIALVATVVSLVGAKARNENSSNPVESSTEEEYWRMKALEWLNYGLDPSEWQTEFPHEAEVEIPDDFVPDRTPYEHFYAENMTDEEIYEVMERIANGENVMFGDGILTDEFEFPLIWRFLYNIFTRQSTK